MDRFKELTTFVEVAQRGSLSAAAREEGITPAMVGRRIDQLEERLGVKLFKRSTRKVTLTPEGSTFYEDCHRLLDELRARRGRAHDRRQERLGPPDRHRADFVRPQAHRPAPRGVHRRASQPCHHAAPLGAPRRPQERALRPRDPHRRPEERRPDRGASSRATIAWCAARPPTSSAPASPGRSPTSRSTTASSPAPRTAWPTAGTSRTRARPEHGARWAATCSATTARC